MKHSHLLLSAFLILICSTAVNAQETPTIDSLYSPKIWLRADLSKKIEEGVWKDQSGNDLHAVSVSTASLPSGGGTINYNPSLVFDGIDDFLRVPFSLENVSEFIILSVYDAADTAEMGIWGAENTLEREILLTTRRVYGPEGIVDSYGGPDSLPLLNTIVQSWGEINKGPETGLLALGTTGKGREDKYFKGNLAEVIVFDKSIPYLERIKYQTYLAIKYGVTHKANYVSSASKVLWDSEKNLSFNNRITGIGRDDVFGLNQKQSVNAYDSAKFLQVSVGNLQKTNEENMSIINNGNFLIWGDNGSTLLDEHREGEDTLLQVVNRKWLVQATGFSANKIGTNIGINITQLPKDSLGYYLLIDRSGGGDFSLDNLEYIEVDSLSADSIAWYTNIRWDKDGSGSDVFSFGRSKYMVAIITAIKNPDCHDKASGRITAKVIGGKPNFNFTMTNGADVSRNWTVKDSTDQEGLTAGSYNLKVKDAEEFVVERTFDLFIPGGLKVDLGEDMKLPENKKIELDASAFIPDSLEVSYHWENNFGFSSSDKKITIEESGIYTVHVTNEEDGCEYEDQIVISGSAVKKFTVMPNVTHSGKVKINVSLEEPAPVTLRIIDAGGGIYYEEKASFNSEFQFSAEVKNPGIYLVVIQTPKGIDSRKLIVY